MDQLQNSDNKSVLQVDIRSGARAVDEMMSDVFVFVLFSWLIIISAFVDFGLGPHLPGVCLNCRSLACFSWARASV